MVEEAGVEKVATTEKKGRGEEGAAGVQKQNKADSEEPEGEGEGEGDQAARRGDLELCQRNEVGAVCIIIGCGDARAKRPVGWACMRANTHPRAHVVEGSA